MISRPSPACAPLPFERDTFAFAHELVWEYRFDAATGRTTTLRTNPPPTYDHRCFVMVRAARQFFYHARFDPRAPGPRAGELSPADSNIVSRSPRRVSAESDRVVIPGYDGLRSFSQAREALLKAECGGPWESYFLRSHWRMVFPVWRRHQHQTAQQLERSVPRAARPVVHLFRFPHITINHGIMLFAVNRAEWGRSISRL